MTKPHVVCVGGGYVAIFVVKALRRAVKRGEIDLTVISRDNFQCFHGFIGEMLTGRIQPQQILSPARRLFDPGRFMNAEVTDIDVEARTLTVSRMLDGKQQQVAFDHLVVGVGISDDLAAYPGLQHHALRLRDYRDAWRTRNHLINMLEMAAIEDDPVERGRLLTFVVAGGGYGGVEIATEVDEWAHELTRKEYPDIDPGDIRTLLIHSGDRILPELQGRHDKLVDKAQRFIVERTELDLRTGVRVVSATPTELRLTDGSVIATRTVITSTGTASSPLLDLLPVDRDERGRVKTDAYVRVPGTTNLWAGGDCAAVPHPDGGTCPQVAIFAMAHGLWIGWNILRTLRGKNPWVYKFDELGDACSLARHNAVAHVRGVNVTGFAGWLLWKAFLLAFVPTWDRRLRIALDWLITPFTGREMTQIALDEALGMTRELHEPGQDVFLQGDVGRKLYLIWSGKVEVVKDGEVVATLGPGEHFGETAVFEETRRTATVRAVERTELVALGKAQAKTLSETLKSFGDVVRSLPGSTRQPREVPEP